jgi:cell wall assembly regulator SMI1
MEIRDDLSNWLVQIQVLVAKNTNMEVGLGASEAIVKDAEIALNVRFPIYFRAYLLQFGFMGIDHYELYGLGNDIPKHLDVVINTLDERQKFRPYMPLHLIPLENTGGGDHFCIDLSAGLNDPPVVFWDHEQDEIQLPELVADQFSLWLLEHTKQIEI